MTKPPTIDAYIAALAPDRRALAQRMREEIQAAAPDAGETVSYGMPAFSRGGKRFIYFAVWKTHIGLYPIYRGDEAFEVELAPYRAKTDTVQLPLEGNWPEGLVGRIVASQLKR